MTGLVLAFAAISVSVVWEGRTGFDDVGTVDIGAESASEV